MNSKSPPPIVFISGFKSGTWLMRKIITHITGLSYHEPAFTPGSQKYHNMDNLQFKEGHYYSWHLVPDKEICDHLREHEAKTIFLLRNIYDVVVSIYYHFYNNIDEDIGRGANKHTFLKRFSFEDGISLIITGFNEPGVRWNGMIEVLEQYNAIFMAASRCNCLLVDFDQLVQNKEKSIGTISQFLETKFSMHDRKILAEQSSFSNMKKEAEKAAIGNSHFRTGKALHNRHKLAPHHRIQLRQMIRISTPDIYQHARDNNMEQIITENQCCPV